MPRPMGNMVTATQPMEVIAADFMEMPYTGKRKGEYKYVLVIVDQLTRICVCVATRDCKAVTAARILCDRWLSFFPTPAFLVTDGGTYFKNGLFREISRIRSFQHHIVAPYCQWNNDRVR